MKIVVRGSIIAMSLVAIFAVLTVCLVFANNDAPLSTEHDHLHHHHFAEFAKVPDKARARLNPLAGDREAVAAGKKLFAQHCAECHGPTAEGGRKAPNLHADEVQTQTAGTLFWILTNGVVRRGMPVWSRLPEPERWQIVAFIKALPSSPNRKMHAEHEHEHAMSDHASPARK